MMSGFLVSQVVVLLVFVTSGLCRDECKVNTQFMEITCANVTSPNLPTDLFLVFEDDIHGFATDMRRLEIQQSNITTLDDTSFKFLPLLTQIILSNISLTEVNPRAFKGLTKLKWVDLSHNKLKHLPADAFKDGKLGHLTLEGNRELEIPTNAPILISKRLSWLSLKNCNIQHLPGSAFRDTSMISHLDLSYNNLEMLPQDIFSPILHLVYLDLSYNKFQTIDHSVFQAIPSYPSFPKNVILSGNPWNCNCKLAKLVQWVTEDFNGDGSWSLIPGSSRLRKLVQCSEPSSLEGKSWNGLRDLVVNC